MRDGADHEIPINWLRPTTSQAGARGLPPPEEEKPGAVHLEFPEDIADEKTDSRPLHRSLVRRPTADEKAVRAAVRMIEAAKSPVLVIGAGANRKMTSRMLLQLIEKTGIPFVTTQLGKGVVR